MKQKRKPVSSKPVFQEVPIPFTKPLSKGLDQLFEAMQLLECQSDALTGIASLHDDLGHQAYLNIVISQKVQEAYEFIDKFFQEIRTLRHPLRRGAV